MTRRLAIPRATYNPPVADDSHADADSARACRRSPSSFPRTTRPRTSRRSSPRRSRCCPGSPTSSRSSPSTTAARTTTPRLADELAAAHPTGARRPPRGQQGLRRRAAQRLPRRALRPGVLPDGDRQFKRRGPGPAARSHGQRRHTRTSWSATASSAPTRPSALAYARAYRTRAADLLPARRPRRRLRLQAVPRAALEGVRLESGGAFLSAELLIKLKQRGRNDRRDRRAALSPHGGHRVRREPQGRLPRDPRLLAPAPAAVGRPHARHSKRGEPVLASDG